MHSATRLRIGENSRPVCTNKGGHRDAFLNEQRGSLSRPLSLE